MPGEVIVPVIGGPLVVPIAGLVSSCDLAQGAATEVKQAGDFFAPRQNPGQVTYDDVTLEQGWSADRTFEEWANAATRVHADPAVTNFKRTLHIEVYDLAGNPFGGAPVTSYKLHRCWVSKYVAVPELSADTGGVGIRSVTLKHEGWERVA